MDIEPCEWSSDLNVGNFRDQDIRYKKGKMDGSLIYGTTGACIQSIEMYRSHEHSINIALSFQLHGAPHSHVQYPGRDQLSTEFTLKAPETKLGGWYCTGMLSP